METTSAGDSNDGSSLGEELATMLDQQEGQIDGDRKPSAETSLGDDDQENPAAQPAAKPDQQGMDAVSSFTRMKQQAREAFEQAREAVEAEAPKIIKVEPRQGPTQAQPATPTMQPVTMTGPTQAPPMYAAQAAPMNAAFHSHGYIPTNDPFKDDNIVFRQTQNMGSATQPGFAVNFGTFSPTATMQGISDPTLTEAANQANDQNRSPANDNAEAMLLAAQEKAMQLQAHYQGLATYTRDLEAKYQAFSLTAAHPAVFRPQVHQGWAQPTPPPGMPMGQPPQSWIQQVPQIMPQGAVPRETEMWAEFLSDHMSIETAIQGPAGTNSSLRDPMAHIATVIELLPLDKCCPRMTDKLTSPLGAQGSIQQLIASMRSRMKDVIDKIEKVITQKGIIAMRTAAEAIRLLVAHVQAAMAFHYAMIIWIWAQKATGTVKTSIQSTVLRYLNTEDDDVVAFEARMVDPRRAATANADVSTGLSSFSTATQEVRQTPGYARLDPAQTGAAVTSNWQSLYHIILVLLTRTSIVQSRDECMKHINPLHFQRMGANETVECYFDRMADAWMVTQQEFTSIGFPLLTPSIDSLYLELAVPLARPKILQQFIAHCQRKKISYTQMTLEDARTIFLLSAEVERTCDTHIDGLLKAMLAAEVSGSTSKSNNNESTGTDKKQKRRDKKQAQEGQAAPALATDSDDHPPAPPYWGKPSEKLKDKPKLPLADYKPFDHAATRKKFGYDILQPHHVKEIVKRLDAGLDGCKNCGSHGHNSRTCDRQRADGDGWLVGHQGGRTFREQKNGGLGLGQGREAKSFPAQQEEKPTPPPAPAQKPAEQPAQKQLPQAEYAAQIAALMASQAEPPSDSPPQYEYDENDQE